MILFDAFYRHPCYLIFPARFEHDKSFFGLHIVKRHGKRRGGLLVLKGRFELLMKSVNIDPVSGNKRRGKKREPLDMVQVQMGHEDIVYGRSPLSGFYNIIAEIP